VRRLTGHFYIVLSVIQLSDGRLCSGSNDETIKIWNLTSGYCEQTLTGHSSIFYSIVQLSDGRLIANQPSRSVKSRNSISVVGLDYYVSKKN
jgi:hypothetical protein